MGFQYTVDQQKVIDLRNRNILVAAAAGSGKTAVLVERIIQLVSNQEEPVDIDRLLIVTFTNAAASEMRERIGAAIERKLESDPLNEHMQKQATLIHNAPITTINSFCLGLLKNHFHDIALDPGFRVGDDAECKLLKQDVLADLLEDYFQIGDEKFLEFVESTSANGSEKGLEELILQLHEASRSYPFPIEWLEGCAKEYQIPNLESFYESEWMQYLMMHCKRILEGCVVQLQQAIVITNHPNGPYMYGDLLEEEVASLEAMLEIDSYEKLSSVLTMYKFGRLPSKKDDSVSLEKRELVKELRSQVKDEFEELKSEFFYASVEDLMTYLQKSASTIEVLIELVIAFSSRFQAKKCEKGVLDFSDMEQYALQILLENQDGDMVPTETAKMYQAYYHEVLIDEYQDSNLVQEYLLKSVSKESMGAYNQFMVGDVKQSIYKFRLARPELFLDKYQTYESTDSLKQKIDLQQNFRSRMEVLTSANYIFEQIMTPQIGGVIYDEKAALNQGATYPSIGGQDQKTEVLLLERENDDSDKKEIEAKMIASRIRELVESFYVTDSSSETGIRKAQYKDIVILLRSNTGWDDTFKKILEQEGIPTHITSKTGYFSVYEVQLVLNFLRILDNPLQDIPLTSVLLSGVIGYSEEEIAIVKGEWKCAHKGKKYRNLYVALEWYTTYGKNEGIIAKAIEFLANLNKYRQMTAYTSIHELLQMFMQELNFQLYLTTLPRGEQRKANLDMLLEKAIEFEQTSYHGLFHFIRYIEQMEKFELNFGEANILDEQANVVRIMSVHKSKGLEFPICFVAGLSKRFNQMDLRKRFVVDMDFGIGMDYVDPVKRTKMKTVRKSAIISKMELDNIGEEIRVLYVALTRAKEKLIMTGVIEKPEKKFNLLQSIRTTDVSQLPFLTIKNASSFLDLILLSLARQKDFEMYLLPMMQTKPLESGTEADFNIRLIQESELEIETFKHAMRQECRSELLLEKIKEATPNESLQAYIEGCFAYEYQYQELAKIYNKTTVTEIKKKRMLEESEDAIMMYPDTYAKQYIPSFIKEEKVTGTQRGNAYHKVMEVLDFRRGTVVADSIRSQIASGRMSELYGEIIRVEKIEHFMETTLGERMQIAYEKGCLYKEQPFVIAIPANEVERDFPVGEDILLQGIIDAYFEEDGELVIVDYKTDTIESAQALMERYHIQLDYYEKALSKLTGKPVKEKVLYSFYLEEVCI